MGDLGFLKRGIEEWDMVDIEVRDGIKRKILIDLKLWWKQFQK